MSAMYFVTAGSVLALLFAAAMFARVKKEPQGSAQMAKISTAVSNGATAYLKRQYKGVAIFFAVVFLIGHSMNMAINVLGAYVHTNRLQFVEFFGKFYEGGGKAYAPFAVNTRHFQIKEEK